MLKVIVQHAAKLVAFLNELKIALYQPQIRHLTQLVDALLVCSNEKTLTNLYRQIAGDPDPKTVADFFRKRNWRITAVSGPRTQFNVYLKEALGLGDFRLQSFEASERWFAVVTLAINSLQYEHLQTYLRTQQSLPLAEILRQHRLSHFQGLLRRVIQEALRTGKIEEVIQQFLPVASWAVT